MHIRVEQKAKKGLKKNNEKVTITLELSYGEVCAKKGKLPKMG